MAVCATMLRIRTLLVLTLLLFLCFLFWGRYQSGFTKSLTTWLPIHFLLFTSLVLLVKTGQKVGRLQLLNYSQLAPVRRSTTLLDVIGLFILVRMVFGPFSDLSTFAYGFPGDAQNWRWILWRFSRELLAGNPFPVRFDDAMWPYGTNLLLFDGYLTTYIGGLWNCFLSPTLAYNFTLITCLSLTFIMSLQVTRRFGVTPSIARLTAASFALAPVFTVRLLGHVNLCGFFMIPVLVGISLEMLSVKPPSFRKVALVMVLAFLSSIYIFVFGAIFCSFFWLTRASIDFACLGKARQKFIALLSFPMAMISALIAVSPFIWSRLVLDRNERSAGAPTGLQRLLEYRYYSADVRSIVSPPPGRLLDLPFLDTLRSGWSPNLLESTSFSGILLLLGIVLVLMKHRNNWVSRPILTSLFWAWVLSLGPTVILGSTSTDSFNPRGLFDTDSASVDWLIYSDFAHIPGLVSLRAPNRAAFVFAGGALAAAVIALQSFKRWRKTMRLSFFCLAVLSLFVSLPRDVPRFPTSLSTALKTSLQKINQSGSGTVLVAGADCIDSVKIANLQIEHGKAIIGCQTFSASVPWYGGIDDYLTSSSLAALRCDPNRFGIRRLDFEPSSLELRLSVLHQLEQEFGVRWIVLDTELPCSSQNRLREIEIFLKENAITVFEDQSGLSVYEISKFEST